MTQLEEGNVTIIRETKDYDKFTFMFANRHIRKQHLFDLKESIKERNMLKFKPIIVSEDMEILDGQHRFTAARELKVPLYYMVAEAEDYDLILANVNQRPLTTVDFTNIFLKRGNQNYAKFADFMKTYKIRIAQALAIIGKSSIMVETKRYKKGKFVWDEANEEAAFKMAERYVEYRALLRQREVKPARLAEQSRAVVALRVLCNHPLFNWDLFIDKLSQHWFLLRLHDSWQAYVDAFLAIYNKGSRTKFSLSLPRDGSAESLSDFFGLE